MEKSENRKLLIFVDLIDFKNMHAYFIRITDPKIQIFTKWTLATRKLQIVLDKA